MQTDANSQLNTFFFALVCEIITATTSDLISIIMHDLAISSPIANASS